MSDTRQLREAAAALVTVAHERHRGASDFPQLAMATGQILVRALGPGAETLDSKVSGRIGQLVTFLAAGVVLAADGRGRASELSTEALVAGVTAVLLRDDFWQGTWSCGRCDQEARGLPVTIPAHYRACPRRSAGS